MFGFLRRKDEIVGLNQKLGRLLNDYCMTNFQEEKQRTESRTRLALPCAMFLFAEARDPKCYAVGVTSDLSLHGLSLVVNEKNGTCRLRSCTRC